MDFEKILSIYTEIKTLLETKKQAIIKRDLDKLNACDEQIKVLCESLTKIDIIEISQDFSLEQKEQLKALGREVKTLQENNEILTKHSLDVINGLLSGIFNIIQSDKKTYGAKGQSLGDESLEISSITEEA